MKMSVTIRLDKPCRENWEEMGEEQRGRLCKVCNKEVIDFTHYEVSDLQNFLLNNPALFCGRFTEEQKNIELKFNKEEKKKLDFIPSIAASVLTFSIVTAGAAPVSYSNAPLINENYISSNKQAVNIQSDTTIITGNVTDENGTPLQNASISYNDIKYLTDENGLFRIVLPSLAMVKGIFIFSYTDLLTEVRNYNPVMGSTTYNIRLRKIPEYRISMGAPVIEFNFPDLNITRLFQKDKLSEEAVMVLSSLANALRNKPNIPVNINTHYYKSQKDALNKAKKLKEYLVEKQGIAEERLIIADPVKVNTKEKENTVSFTASRE